MDTEARRTDSDTPAVPPGGSGKLSTSPGRNGAKTVRSVTGQFVSKSSGPASASAKAQPGGDELTTLEAAYGSGSAVKELPAKAKRQKAPVRAAGRSKAADDPLAPERTRWLAEVVGGGARLAELLGVSASQTSRWAAGQERPGIQVAPLLIDLEHVLARVRLVWAEPAASTWMVSVNAHLGGARPVDVLRLHGPGPVLDALDAGVWGGAA